MATLDERIAEAAEELTKDKPLAEETQAEETQESGEETGLEVPEDEEVKEGSDELSEEEKAESQRLYKALKDPSKGPKVLEALAYQAGLLGKNAPETKAEARAAVKTVKEILAEGLGKEYAFLADKLGPAIEAVFDIKEEEQNAKFQQIEAEKVQQQVVGATESFFQKTPEAKAHEKRISQLAEEIPIGNLTVDKYLRYLFTIASNEKGGRKGLTQTVADKIRQNANDAPGRLRTASGVRDEPNLPHKKLGLKGSINFALEQLAKQRK